MMINGSLPLIPLAQEPSSSLPIQPSPESGGGDFSALLFLIFATPIAPAAAVGTGTPLPQTEESSVENGAVNDANPGDDVEIAADVPIVPHHQIVTQDFFNIAFAEPPPSSVALKGIVDPRKLSSDLKSLETDDEGDALSAMQSSVIGTLPVFLQQPVATSGAQAPADSSAPARPALAQLGMQLPAAAHSSLAAAAEKPEHSPMQPPASTQQPSEIFSFAAPAAHSSSGPEQQVVAALPDDPEIASAPAAANRNDMVKTLSHDEKKQAIADFVNAKKAAPTEKNAQEPVKIFPSWSMRAAANQDLPAANVTAKSGASIAPEYRVARPAQPESSTERPVGPGEKPSSDQRIGASFSAAPDSSSAFDFAGGGERGANDLFKNSRDRFEAANPAANFSAISVRSAETGAASEAKPEVAWPPVIKQVAAEIAANARRNKHEAVITLDPPELGKLRIGLTVEGDKVQVRIFAQARESQGLIENHLPDLKQALIAHRLDLVDARVDGGVWNGGGTGDLMHGFQQNPKGQQEPGWSTAHFSPGGNEIVEPPAAEAVAQKGRVSIRA